MEVEASARAQRAAALEAWAERVAPGDLVEAETAILRTIAELALRRDELDARLAEAVSAARTQQRTWAEIGIMLGVSKQAAHRKYGNPAPT